jgi:hypothetical protein
MERQIKIAVGELEVDAWLNETDTATGVLDILPVTATFSLWGEEIYLSIPLEKEEENAREIVDVGDIAFWPRGQALCIFLGRTPISQGDEPRAISPVNVIGGISPDGVKGLLGAVKQGDSITIRR